MKRIYKSRHGMIDGVCKGIAEYLGLDVTLVRIIFVVLAVAGFSSVLAYIICAVIFPREPEDTIYKSN